MSNQTKQCKTCAMTGEVKDYLDESLKQGISFRQMARELDEVFGIHIADTSLGNHFKNHVHTVGGLKINSNTGTMSADLITPAVTPNNTPKGWTPSVKIDEDGNGEVITKPQTGTKKIKDFTSILDEMGIDSDSFEVVGTAGMSRWEQRAFNKKTSEYETTWLTAYKVQIREKRVDSSGEVVEDVDLPLLATQVRKFGTGFGGLLKNRKADRTFLAIGGDFQVGKVGSRGGTVELMNRMRGLHEVIADYSADMECGSAAWLDAGDIIEGFENTAQQITTNDLSLMNQVDLAHTLESEWIDLLASKHGSLDVMSVPSNHTAWRKGKDYLGRPIDDWGIHIAKQIEKEYDKYLPGHGVRFHYSDVWKKSLNVPIQGYGIGLTHGDDGVGGPEKVGQWWEKQVHGAGPTAKSDILVHGHWHTPRVTTSGRSLLTGAQKWILGAPTMDNGSDWFANGSGGGDSDPGMMTFVVEKGKGLVDFKFHPAQY